ncbi:MAG: LacI family DNA-binding transcriptional regulator [Alphaproteobacteria bacterium]|nr:LacI family DNA-binding transcriptional regulator [Alphaproteobacteria bacterium]
MKRPTRAKQRSPRPTANTITVREVAAAARVSMATVSRALNGNPGVAAELSARVLAAASKLGYTPHAAARALASQRSRTIGAVVPTLENGNFAVGIAALQRRLTAAGYTLLLGSSDYDRQEELRQVQALAAHGVAAMMLVGAHHAPGLYAFLEARNIPYVNTWVLDRARPCVGFDNREIGAALATHLIELGHTAVGVIAQVGERSDRAAQRVRGIRAALHERGLGPPQERFIERPHKIVEGQLALRALMAQARRPTAVICGTDVLAAGALIEARRLGVAVPEELSIAGINDVEYAAHLTPPLTTVRLPADEIGARAADYLLARVGGQPVAAVNRIEFELVVRASTAPPSVRPRAAAHTIAAPARRLGADRR